MVNVQSYVHHIESNYLSLIHQSMRVVILIVLALFPFLIHSQEVRMKPIAAIEMEVCYELDQLCDYPNEANPKGWREQSTLILEIGRGMTHSYVVEEHQDLIRQFANFRDKNNWKLKLINTHALLGETFTNCPRSGMLTQVVNLDAEGVYQYVEPVPEMKWEMGNRNQEENNTGL